MITFQSAAIPYRRTPANGLEILLVTSRRSGRWVLPKGKVKGGMPPHRSAALEAFEEAGVRGEIDRIEVGVYRQQKIAADGSGEEIAVRAFPLRVDEEMRNWPEANARRRAWMRADDAVDAVKDTALRAIIVAFATGRSASA